MFHMGIWAYALLNVDLIFKCSLLFIFLTVCIIFVYDIVLYVYNICVTDASCASRMLLNLPPESHPVPLVCAGLDRLHMSIFYFLHGLSSISYNIFQHFPYHQLLHQTIRIKTQINQISEMLNMFITCVFKTSFYNYICNNSYHELHPFCHYLTFHPQPRLLQGHLINIKPK